MTAETVDPSDTLAVLRAARAWLDDPRHWTRGVCWRRSNGHESVGRHAVARTCALGALSFVAGADDPTNWPRGARVALERYCDAHSISLVNDDKGAHPEILAIYDRAIESLGARS